MDLKIGFKMDSFLSKMMALKDNMNELYRTAC